MRLCLVEDGAVGRLGPLTSTRPVYDLLLGRTTLGAKLARAFRVGPGPARRGAWIRPRLEAVQRERDPRTTFNDRDWLARGPVWIVNARWVPPSDFEPPALGASWLGFHEGRPACALVGPEFAVGLEPGGVDTWFESVANEPTVDHLDLGGEWIDHPRDLVQRNGDHLDRDFDALGQSGASNRQFATLALVGPSDRLFIHETARIDPYTVFDTTRGSISVGPGAWIQPFTRLEGPCSIGPRSRVRRAELRDGVTVGPDCQVSGELHSCILHGQVQKDHEGRLSHAYLGEWVHLGAGTCNEDPPDHDRVAGSPPFPGEPAAATTDRIGCFIGDRSRTGPGSLLGQGVSIGVMCDLRAPGVLLSRHVPCFTAILPEGRATVSGPGRALSNAEERLYRDLFEQTHFERQRVLQRADDRDGKHRQRAASG